ncbi:helix-turn-helix domain-containing protein [Hydrogenophaga sp. OTU3427]|uniref:helix-turn-helix domain-containing protein n=1 Tax=Hydrogenophaga sp. OTU3427 TaxID=3043856 RepID=UPI00313A8551
MSHSMPSGSEYLPHFATEGPSDDAKAHAFRQRMQDMFSVGLNVKSLEARPLAAQMMAYRGRKLRFAALRFSPHSTVSSPAPAGKETRLLVSLHKKGPAVVSQGGRENRIETGDLFVIDPSRPFYIETGEIETHSLYVNATELRHLVPELDVATARAIRCDSGVGALFRSTVDEVFTMAPSLTEDVADEIADALLHLLAPVVRSSVQATEHCPNRLASMHRQRIVRFVRENLSDSNLDANMIASGVNLSPRHVYQLFDDAQKPLMRWVWAERMARCRRDLEQPSLRTKTIGEIAFQWGFSNVSHFSRAFKAEFGMTPRELRKNAGIHTTESIELR